MRCMKPVCGCWGSTHGRGTVPRGISALPPCPTAAPSSANRPPAAATAPATSAAVPAGTSASNESATAKPEGEKASTTVLPKMEVRKGKFSERDYQLAQDLHKQDQEIEREKRNLKTSETDSALNNAKVSSALSVFGGESASYRKRVAAERLELLEAEKDIIEQIAIAQKPEEKQLLQKQLDELREMRRHEPAHRARDHAVHAPHDAREVIVGGAPVSITGGRNDRRIAPRGEHDGGSKRLHQQADAVTKIQPTGLSREV